MMGTFCQNFTSVVTDGTLNTVAEALHVPGPVMSETDRGIAIGKSANAIA